MLQNEECRTTLQSVSKRAPNLYPNPLKASLVSTFERFRNLFSIKPLKHQTFEADRRKDLARMRVISASDIRGMHKTDLRQSDSTSFVHCSLFDGTNCWVERHSLDAHAPILAGKLKLIEQRCGNWDKMKIGGRPRTLTQKSECIVRCENIETASEPTTPHDDVKSQLKKANDQIVKMDASINELRAQIADLTAKREIERAPCAVNSDHAPIALPFAMVDVQERQSKTDSRPDSRPDSLVKLESQLPTPRASPSVVRV